MLRILLATTVLLIATPVLAKDVTVTLTDKEQVAIAQLLDLAVKAGGLKAAGAADFFLRKFSPEPVKPDLSLPKAPVKPEAPKPEPSKK